MGYLFLGDIGFFFFSPDALQNFESLAVRLMEFTGLGLCHFPLSLNNLLVA